MRTNYGQSAGTGAVSRVKKRKWKKSSVSAQSEANAKRAAKSGRRRLNTGVKRNAKR